MDTIQNINQPRSDRRLWVAIIAVVIAIVIGGYVLFVYKTKNISNTQGSLTNEQKLQALNSLQANTSVTPTQKSAALRSLKTSGSVSANDKMQALSSLKSN